MVGKLSPADERVNIMMKKKRFFTVLLTSVLAGNAASYAPCGLGGTNAAVTGVCINEICSQNKSCLADSYGSYSDWIEFYNASGSEIDISGYGLSDSAAEPQKYVFPDNTIIGAGEHFIVFASKKESVSGELHTGFSISKNGETILLSDPSGRVIEQIEVPTLGEDMSYGRTPDGADTFEIMEASPAKANAAVTSAPVFSQESGFYGSDFALTLTAESGTQIYYTTDGSDPKTSNTAQICTGTVNVSDRTNQPNIYSAYGESESAESVCRGIGYRPPSFNVDKATVVRAAAKSADGRFSETVSRTYFITSGNLAQYKNITVVSLVTDPDDLFDPENGIYVTGNQYMSWKNSGAYDPNKSIWDTDNVCNYFSRGKSWEREASITVFENGSAVVEQGMGIRIKGASTRNHAQKSFNLYARSEYGASKINYPLFPDNVGLSGELVDKYDSISLRSVTDEARLNDSFSQKLLSGRDDLGLQEMKPCVVFLNGEYWGLYEMTERLSAYFIESNYGVRKQDVAMIKSGESEEGPQEECDSFLDFANEYSKKDLTNEVNYKAVCDFIDIDSMIDHYAAGLYLGTYDWPNRNYGAWRNMGSSIDGNPYSDGKWRFITYDLDYTVGATYDTFGGVEGYAYDSFRHMEKEAKYAPTNLFISLLKNREFRDKFAGVYCDYAIELLTKQKGTALADEYSRSYTDILAQNLLRWWGFYGGSPSDTLAWNKTNYQNKVIPGIKAFFDQRESYTLDHMKNYLGLSGSLQTITLRTGGHGTIQINSIAPDLSNGSWSGKYYSDCPVTVTAIPDEGYSFAGWQGDASGSDMTISMTLSKAMSIQADFTEQKEVKGDVNGDGMFNVADLVVLQKWLLGAGDLADPNAADLCSDGNIDVFDVVVMRRELF